MRILIAWADDSSPNLGVRALGRGSADLLGSLHPGAHMEFMNYGSKPDALNWPTRSLIKERLLSRTGMMEWLSSFDLLWDTRSGDSFADIYGLARHSTMSLIHEFAAQAGVQCVMAPQTIGPFRTHPGRVLARRNLHRSSLVFARDPASASAAAELGRPADALTTDMVFAVDQPVPAAQRDVVVNVSGLLWGANPHVRGDDYRGAVKRIIEALLSDGRTVTLMPHVLQSADPDNDVPAVRAAQEMFSGDVDVVVPDGLDDVRAIVSGARLVIGARMHACLNALSTGTPAIAMAYSRKFRPLLAEIGWDHVVDISDASATAAAVLRSVHHAELPAEAREAQQAGRGRIAVLRDRVSALSA